jgi:hypothetical protein
MLTQIERTILLIARHRILSHQNTYLCMAIRDAPIKTFEGMYASMRLRMYLERMLKPWGSLDGWQYDNGFGNRSEAQKRQDRLDWIDWILSEEE